jgi:hypothetical protein
MGYRQRAGCESQMLKGKDKLMRFVFVNCIAAGQIDWKAPLLAAHQPSIREAAMIYTDENLAIEHESVGELSGEELARYANAVANGAVVVGHSVEYQHGHLRAALIAAGLDPSDGRAQTICSMFGLTGLAPKANGRKGWPTFAEACEWACVERAATESAEDNARCLLMVFKNWMDCGPIPEPKIWKERNAK